MSKFDPDKIDFMPDAMHVGFIPTGKTEVKYFVDKLLLPDSKSPSSKVILKVTELNVVGCFTPADTKLIFDAYCGEINSNLPEFLTTSGGALLVVYPMCRDPGV